MAAAISNELKLKTNNSTKQNTVTLVVILPRFTICRMLYQLRKLKFKTDRRLCMTRVILSHLNLPSPSWKKSISRQFSHHFGRYSKIKQRQIVQVYESFCNKVTDFANRYDNDCFLPTFLSVLTIGLRVIKYTD